MSDFAGTSTSPENSSKKPNTTGRTAHKNAIFSPPTSFSVFTKTSSPASKKTSPATNTKTATTKSPNFSKAEVVQKIIELHEDEDRLELEQQHYDYDYEEESFDHNVVSHEMLNDLGFALTLEPVREIIRDIFHILTWAELWGLYSSTVTSVACKRALTEYLRGLETIHVSAAEFNGMTKDEFLILLQYTSMIQSLETDDGLNPWISVFIDHNVINTLFMKNRRLQSLKTISAVGFDHFLNPQSPLHLIQFDSLSLHYLRQLHLFFPEDQQHHHFDTHTVKMFFLRLEQSCPSISSLELTSEDGNSDIVVNSDALSYISRLPLENFEAENIIFTARLDQLLANCTHLKRLVLHGDDMDDHVVEDASRYCRRLQDFYVYCDNPDAEPSRDYCAYATQLIRANRKLKSFSYLNNQMTYNTCNAETLDVMKVTLADLRELSFFNEEGFYSIGEKFYDVVDKFRNLYKLIIHSGFISQRWLDVIGENCSNLLELHLKEKYDIPRDNRVLDDIGKKKNISTICNRNVDLQSLYLHFRREIEGCRAISRLDLKFLVLSLPPSTDADAIETDLGERYSGMEVTRNPTRLIISYIE